MKLPHCVRPCAKCPFRQDCLPEWLGAERAAEILAAPSFVCHETTALPPTKLLQCAGHMIIRGEQNQFVRLAARLKIPLKLKGHELVFETPQHCINHHSKEKNHDQ